MTARALRRSPGDADTFPQDVLELIMYFKAPPGQRVQAIPGAGLDDSDLDSRARACSARSSRPSSGCRTDSPRILRPR